VKFLFKKSGFTFVELVVSMLISSIILTSVFYFISQNIDEINSSTNRTKFFDEFYGFRDKFIYYSNIYTSWSILINNSSSSWSDILLMQNELSTDWIIFWVVDENTMKLEKKQTAYNVYYNKSVWFKRVSTWEITAIKSNSWYVYTIWFYKDNVYDKLKMKDLQMEMYNSWSIMNVDLTILKDYNPEYMWSNWTSLKWIEFYKFNLNF